MGDRFFSKVQFGTENPAAHGTPVAATRTLVGGQVGPITPYKRPRKINENIGVRSAGHRKVIDQYLVSDSLSIPEGYFQALLPILGCGLKGAVTATETTADQSDYAWDFTPSLASDGANAPDSLTIEKGDNTQAFEAEYCMFQRVRISGQVAQGADAAPVSIEAEYFGRQWTPTTFTGSIAIPVTTPLNAKLARVYVDTSWAGLGGTELANILRAFDLDIILGPYPNFAGSAAKTFNRHGEGIIGAQLSLTLEGLSAADALWDAANSDTQALSFVQLALGGPQIGTGASHSAKFNLAGTWDEVIPLAEEDRGNNLHTLVMTSLYDPTAAKEVGAVVVTDRNSY
ncbi:MAG: hypothetical protein KG029_13780 [Bacteroidetes bacterium]|nr:hypothetical protein [Bacteroidota bacterium]